MRGRGAVAVALSASLLCAMPGLSGALAAPPPFGRGLRTLFGFASNLTNLNQGSYGAPPLAVLEARHDAMMEMESRCVTSPIPRAETRAAQPGSINQ